MSRILTFLVALLFCATALTVRSQAQGGHNVKLFGTVADLAATATGSSFNLKTDPHHTTSVLTASATTVTNKSDGSAATLANGQKVLVNGTYDDKTKTVTATSIVVDDHKPPPPPPVKLSGVVADLKTGVGFNLQDDHHHKIAVLLTSATTVTNASDGSPATLANGQKVVASGTYDDKTKTLTAASIVVDDHKPTVKLFGTVADLTATATGDTFTLQGDHNHSLTVIVTADTKITNASDGSAATLADGQRVLVIGTLDSTTSAVTAASIVVDDHIPPPPPPVKLTGVVADLTPAATGGGTFTLHGDPGHSVSVAYTATTTITNPDGSAATLANGQKVVVTGTYNPASQSVTATGIVVLPPPPPHPNSAYGTVLSVDAATGSFVLTVKGADFKPTGATITVTTDSKTVISKGASNHPGTFADITVGATVHVSGPFDATTQTLAAAFVFIGGH